MKKLLIILLFLPFLATSQNMPGAWQRGTVAELRNDYARFLSQNIDSLVERTWTIDTMLAYFQDSIVDTNLDSAQIAAFGFVAGEQYILSVGDFANGDGITDVTSDIEEAMDSAVSQSKILWWPKDTNRYIIDRLVIPSDITIIFEAGTEIEGLVSASTGLFYLNDVENITLIGNGAKIYQSRSGSTNNMNYILGSKNIIFDNFRLHGSGKDGIYVGTGTSGDSTTNLVISNMVIDSMSRQGISIVHANGVRINGGKIRNTTGSSPAAGIDLEGNGSTTVRNIIIDGVYFEGNLDQGAVAVFKATDVIIQNCVFENNLFACNIDLAGTSENSFDISSIDNATDIITLDTIHGFKIGDYIRWDVVGGGTLPTGVTSTTTIYRVLSVPTDTTLTFSTSYKYDQVDMTSTGSLPLQIKKYIIEDNSRIAFINNILKDNSNNFYAEQAQYVSFTGNKITGGYGGINLINVAHTQIVGNHLQGNTGGRAIYVTDHHAIISNNTVINSDEDAIEIIGSENSVISGNVIHNAGITSGFAIWLKYVQNSIVSNNTITHDTTEVIANTYGIVFDGVNASKNMAFGNNIQNNYGSTSRSIVSVVDSNYVFANVLNDGLFYPGDGSAWTKETDKIYTDINKVGIGTPTPIFTLDIHDAAPLIRLYDESGPYTQLLQSNNSQFRISAATNLSLRSGSSGTVELYANGATALTANASQEILVGVADQGAYLLQVGGNIHFNGVQLHTGTGSPEGVVTAVVGSMYLRTDGGAGTTLYIKESGTGNTGWVAK